MSTVRYVQVCNAMLVYVEPGMLSPPRDQVFYER